MYQQWPNHLLITWPVLEQYQSELMSHQPVIPQLTRPAEVSGLLALVKSVRQMTQPDHLLQQMPQASEAAAKELILLLPPLQAD